MTKEITTFSDVKAEKHKFHCYKSRIVLEDVDLDNVLISSKISFGKKKLKNTLLVTCVMIIKLNHYIKCFRRRVGM